MVKEVNLSEYVPDYYEGVKDMKELVRVENALFKDGTISLEQFIKNQFIMLCDVPTLTKFEEVYGIVAHADDTLEWRRERFVADQYETTIFMVVFNSQIGRPFRKRKVQGFSRFR